MLSFLATGTLDGEVEGINDLQAAVRAALRRPATTCPIIPVTYWTFRLMIGFGVLAGCSSAAGGLWLTRRGRRTRPARALVLAGRPPGPFAAVRREQRRLDLHRDGPPALDRVRAATHGRRRLAHASAPARSLTSLVVFTLLYGVLAVVEVG